MIRFKFTKKEQQIFNFLQYGKSLDEICCIMNVTRTTVKTHLANIFRKTNTHSVTELLLMILSNLDETIAHIVDLEKSKEELEKKCEELEQANEKLENTNKKLKKDLSIIQSKVIQFKAALQCYQ